MTESAAALLNSPAEEGATPGDVSPPVSALLTRADAFAASFERISNGRLNPFSIVIEDTVDPAHAVIDGRPTLMFGTNSYLGLNFHPNCVSAAVEATKHWGTGSTASRVAAGNHRLHVELEAEIAAFHGRRDAVVFSTGFMANLGVITALARKDDAIFVDAHCHASIFDACRLSGAEVSTFRHNDASDLDRLFATSDVPASQVLVVVEGLYSVHGDLGELKSLAVVTKRQGAVLIVDEAHGLGLYGRNGRGVAEQLGVENDVDVIVGTFSKSVGVIGGYAVSNHRGLRGLRLMARSYLYSASLPLSVVAAARESLRLIATDHSLRETVWSHSRRLHAAVSALGFDLCAAPAPVGGIRPPGLATGYQIWRELLARGVYVNLLIPPATPDGAVILRYSLSAAHSVADIDVAIDAFSAASRLLGGG